MMRSEDCVARGFKFRLEKVLDMRIQKEQRLQQRFQELLAMAEFERQKLAALEERQQQYREELSQKQKGSVEVNEVMNYLSYLELLAEAIIQQTEILREAEERAEEARLDLVQASQEKKAVEKLKEKQLEEYNKEQLREEIIFLDDISSSRFNRNKTEAARNSGRSAPRGP